MARSLSEWGIIADIVSASVVTLSLIFVGFQIRDSTVASEAATLQDSVSLDIALLLDIGSSPETARVFYTFRNDPDSLNENEARQGQALFFAASRQMENLYLQRQAGMLSDEAWESREPLVRAVVLTPGFGKILGGAYREAYGVSFIKYAERVRAHKSAE